MSNDHRQFSLERMHKRLALDRQVVISDFTALAMALPRLAPAGKQRIGRGGDEPELLAVTDPAHGRGTHLIAGALRARAA